MNPIIAGSILGILGLVSATQHGSEAATSEASAARGGVATLAALAAADVGRAVLTERPAVVPVRALGLAEPARLMSHGRVIHLPRGFHASEDGRFDVVVHFHGAHTHVERALATTGIQAALVVVNLGVGSGPYESTFFDAGALDRLLADTEEVVAGALGGDPPRSRRVALSAWSAGYGAVGRMLSHEQAAARVDAVLLADGLHAGFVWAGSRSVDPLRMGPFERLAVEAASGGKLFALTHSAIPTGPYASTTETADHLLRHLGLTRGATAGTMAAGMRATSRVARGSFELTGFEGGNEQAHGDHLRGLGETLFPALAARWSASPSG